MRLILILITTFLLGCNTGVNVSDSYHHIVIDNPIIEFCERLYPEVIYKDYIERELLIVECLSVCNSNDTCTVDFNSIKNFN